MPREGALTRHLSLSGCPSRRKGRRQRRARASHCPYALSPRQLAQPLLGCTARSCTLLGRRLAAGPSNPAACMSIPFVDWGTPRMLTGSMLACDGGADSPAHNGPRNMEPSPLEEGQPSSSFVRRDDSGGSPHIRGEVATDQERRLPQGSRHGHAVVTHKRSVFASP